MSFRMPLTEELLWLKTSQSSNIKPCYLQNMTPGKLNYVNKIYHVFFCLWNHRNGKIPILLMILKTDIVQKSWMLQQAWEGEKNYDSTFRQRSKVKDKVCKSLSQDMPTLHGRNWLEAVTLEKPFKDTNLDTLIYAVYQDCTAAKIQP